MHCLAVVLSKPAELAKPYNRHNWQNFHNRMTDLPVIDIL
jgi:hypothetical protein